MFGLKKKLFFVPYLYQRANYSILSTPFGTVRFRGKAHNVNVAFCIAQLVALVALRFLIPFIWKRCCRRDRSDVRPAIIASGAGTDAGDADANQKGAEHESDSSESSGSGSDSDAASHDDTQQPREVLLHADTMPSTLRKRILQGPPSF